MRVLPLSNEVNLCVTKPNTLSLLGERLPNHGICNGWHVTTLLLGEKRHKDIVMLSTVHGTPCSAAALGVVIHALMSFTAFPTFTLHSSCCV